MIVKSEAANNPDHRLVVRVILRSRSLEHFWRYDQSGYFGNLKQAPVFSASSGSLPMTMSIPSGICIVHAVSLSSISIIQLKPNGKAPNY